MKRTLTVNFRQKDMDHLDAVIRALSGLTPDVANTSNALRASVQIAAAVLSGAPLPPFARRTPDELRDVPLTVDAEVVD